jgi:hypothetical protein
MILVIQRHRAKPTISGHESNVEVAQVDDSLVTHLLTLSPEQRIDAHEAARELVRDLMNAGREYYARQSKGST